MQILNCYCYIVICGSYTKAIFGSSFGGNLYMHCSTTCSAKRNHSQKSKKPLTNLKNHNKGQMHLFEECNILVMSIYWNIICWCCPSIYCLYHLSIKGCRKARVNPSWLWVRNRVHPELTKHIHESITILIYFTFIITPERLAKEVPVVT